MTTIDRPNRDALNRAIDIYRDAMRPFIVRNLKKVQGGTVEQVVLTTLRYKANEIRDRLTRGAKLLDLIDVGDFPALVSRNWREVFADAFHNEADVQSFLHIIAGARNAAVHVESTDLDAEYTRSRLTDVAAVLGRINEPNIKRQVEMIRDQQFAAAEPPLFQPTPLEAGTEQPKPTRAAANLKPWHDVIAPSDDVMHDTFQEAAFVADLSQVYRDEADASTYGNPVFFFNRTYITPGLETLLANTLRRLAGRGGAPVIQTKTGFGGGKTHSLIALLHLVRSAEALLNLREDSEFAATGRRLREIASSTGFDPAAVSPRLSVLSGTWHSPTMSDRTEDGDPLDTLWGVMAHQLGGQDAYNLVGDAARLRLAPGGSELDRLFAHVGPCVVLIDELVNYVRNADDATQDRVYSFIQNLTESAGRSDNAVVVMTLPESAHEAGTPRAVDALARLEAILGRIEAVWKPLDIEEAFEVVRRRLFSNDSDLEARDATCKAFAAVYGGRNRSEFPPEVREARYIQRLKDCYPIHPEIFDRLYNDWSTIPEFQRTRGVLRLMANAISRLYLRGDSSPLIMPANLPLDNATLNDEFVKLLPGNWDAVLGEVDSDESAPDRLDKAHAGFNEVGGAARRLTRAIFLGSAPVGASRGVDAHHLRLATVQPGHGVAVYNDALTRLARDLYHLYTEDGRYYFHVEPNLNRVAADRRGNIELHEIDDYIVGRLRNATGRRSDVIICPDQADRNAVPEADYVRLVILGPTQTLPDRKTGTDSARAAALQILTMRDRAETRTRRNTLVFLAARVDDLNTLRNHVRDFLAWSSILDGGRRLENLDQTRLTQAMDSLSAAERNVRAALVRAYRWALAPAQSDPQKTEYVFTAYGIDETGNLADAAFDALIEAEALVPKISPDALQTMLERHIWNNPDYGDYVDVSTLWSLLTDHVWLHRLRSAEVLHQCIEAGVTERTFGHAEEYDPRTDEYLGLRYGPEMPTSTSDLGVEDTRGGFLVHPRIAREKREEQRAAPTPPPTPPPAPSLGTTHIQARARLRGAVSQQDFMMIHDGIIQNLGLDGVDLTVDIEISARNDQGFPENAVRSLRENCKHLNLDFYASEGYTSQ